MREAFVTKQYSVAVFEKLTVNKRAAEDKNFNTYPSHAISYSFRFGDVGAFSVLYFALISPI
jgi:hypothetical protein